MAIEDSGLSEAKRELLAQRLRGERVRIDRETTTHHLPGPVPLSVTQEQLWYFSQLVPDSPVYNEVGIINRKGTLDYDALRRAVRELVQRHTIWRTTFKVVGSTPVQLVQSATDLELPLIDLSMLAPAEIEREAARLAADLLCPPYQLDRLPLLRPLLIRLARDHHRMYLANHLLIVDGVSMYRIVMPELIELYDAYACGRAPTLRPPSLQYSDYATWSQKWTTSTDFTRRMQYWRSHLSGAPMLQLPLDKPRPSHVSFHGAMEPLHLSRALSERLQSLSAQENATLFQVIAAAFSVLLHRYSGGQDDIVFAVSSDFRPRTELETVVGYCVTPLVLRVDMSDQPTFGAVLHRIRAGLLDGMSNQVPFGRLVRELQPPRDSSVNPVFQAMLTLEPPATAIDPAWSFHQMDTELGNVVGCAKVDLEFEFDQRPEGHIDGRLIYNTDVFETATARSMVGHWVRVLEGILANPSRPVSEIPLLSEQELSRLADWNATDADYPRDVCVHQLISAQASRSPEAVAAVCRGDVLTYRDLEQRANRLAHRLTKSQARGRLIAICVDRSLDMLVGMLAILKAGGAYLPLDWHHPPERLALVLEDSGAPVLLTQRKLLLRLPSHGAEVICIEDVVQEPAEPVAAVPVSPDDLAYVLYTSGSTGRPKGVCVNHRALVNLLTSMSRTPGMSEADTILAVTTYAFDIAAVELWLPLITGARVVIAPQDVASDGRRLAGLIAESSASIVQATPATWQMLIDAGWAGRPNLVALCGGEVLPRHLADALIERSAALWNMFGPTETTVWSTIAQVRSGNDITIGRPIANTTVYVVDQHLQLVPVGVAGELFIGGEGVARGYLNRPDLTEQRFVADPFSATEGARMYRTGDLVRQRSDGNLEYLGRLDHQVKIRGNRVECGEVEAALADHPAVAEAIVVARDGEDKAGQRLVAYTVATAGWIPRAEDLRAHLGRRLPEYMVPVAFMALQAFPLTPNGKVDRNALPDPDWQPGARFRPPRSQLEERMAAIWAQTLHVQHVGIDDDFFELGGHSLLAVRLLVNVEREFGVAVPLAAVFDGSPTVSRLAEVVAAAGESGDQDAAASAATPILFFVQPGESAMLTLRHFTRVLTPDQRIVGLLPERMGARFDQSRSIEDLAAALLRTIREDQPQGPYYLAGFSLGGLLAYEIASQLRASGDRVAWVALLDTAPPVFSRQRMRHRLSLPQRLSRQRDRGLAGATRHTGRVILREVTAALVRLHLRRSRFGDDFDWRGALKLASRYACGGNDAPMDLFTAAEGVAGSGSRSLGWDQVHKGPLLIHEVTGGHESMMTEPHVTTVAAIFQQSLRRAQSLHGW